MKLTSALITHDCQCMSNNVYHFVDWLHNTLKSLSFVFSVPASFSISYHKPVSELKIVLFFSTNQLRCKQELLSS